MSNRCKVRANWFSAGLVVLNVFIITFSLNAKYEPRKYHQVEEQTTADTVPARKTTTPRPTTSQTLTADTFGLSTDTTRSTDTLQRSTDQQAGDTAFRNDTGKIRMIDTLDFKVSKDTLDAPVTYAAADSGVLIIPTRQFILYGKATTRYSDLELTAATIKLEQEKQLVYAYGDRDTLGNPLDKPKLVQGGMTSFSDSIVYNLKTEKGLTKSSYLQEGEMFVFAERVKKINNDELFAWHGRFTTCNLDTPHFAFRTRKMKIVNKKLAVSGPAFPEFEGVPVPIGIPFGIYPLSRGRHSGILPPSFASNESFGLGIEGLGYYKVVNDNLDVTVRSNIYSYGGWNLNISPRYMKRYRYTGGLNLALQRTRSLNTSILSKEEFNTQNGFQISWNHTRDAKSRPGSSFSANVNAGSTKFNRLVPNNSYQNFQNQLSSSITYSKDWRGKYNLTLSANHDQNSNTGLINLRLPSVSFNAVTFYPFQKEEQVGTPKWYEKLGIGYTGSLENQVSFYGSDTLFGRPLLQRLLDTAQWSATHNVPITLSLPQLGPIQVAPGVSYSERWYGQAFQRYYDTASKRGALRTTRGFYMERDMNFSLSANTRIFGTYQFKKTNKVQAIRHEVRPTLSLNYKPDLNRRNYSLVKVNDTLNTYQYFSDITGALSTGQRVFGGVSFGIDNTLEMKVRDKKDTAAGASRKVRLIDGFGFSSAYNLMADSFQLSPFSLYLRSNLFEKINITANAVLDPYGTTAQGFRSKELAWNSGRFNPGRITGGSVAMSTQFKSKSKDGRTDEQRLPQDQFMTPDEQQRQLDYVRSNPAEYTDFNIPWSVSLSYSLNFNRVLSVDFSRFTTEINSNVSVNGDFSLTPRWKMGGSTYYDFRTSKIQTLTMFISREMHCWQMSINLTPIGLYRSFNVSINPKSGILRDLKINRARTFSSM